MTAASRTTNPPRSAKPSWEVRRALALTVLAIAATAGGIGIAALAFSFSGSGTLAPGSVNVGPQHSANQMFTPAERAGTKDIWYLEKRGAGVAGDTDRIRDGHDRK